MYSGSVNAKDILPYEGSTEPSVPKPTKALLNALEEIATKPEVLDELLELELKREQEEEEMEDEESEEDEEEEDEQEKKANIEVEVPKRKRGRPLGWRKSKVEQENSPVENSNKKMRQSLDTVKAPPVKAAPTVPQSKQSTLNSVNHKITFNIH